MFITSLLSATVNLLLPAVCPACGRDTIDSALPVCLSCWDKLHFEEYPSISSSESIEKIFSCYLYANTAKKCVKQFKYKNAHRMVHIFGPAIENILKKNSISAGTIDVIISVPLHISRIRERGYNQSDIIANIVSKNTGIPALGATLIKTKNTHTQAGLTRKERLENLSGSFKVRRREELNKKRILLVDDVITTGSTLETCARELLANGASSVTGFTVARTL